MHTVIVGTKTKVTLVWTDLHPSHILIYICFHSFLFPLRFGVLGQGSHTHLSEIPAALQRTITARIRKFGG